MKSVSVEEFCRFSCLSHMRFSPEGDKACFAVAKADMEKNAYTSEIWKLEGRKCSQLTAGGREKSFVFLDNDTVLFAGDRDGKEKESLESKYYAITLNGGEARKKFTFPIPTGDLTPLGNGDFVLTGTVFPGYEELYTGSKKLAEAYWKNRRENSDYEEVTEAPWWWNGSTFHRGAYDALFYYDAGKKKLSPLSKWGFDVSNVRLSLDGKYVYFAQSRKQTVLDVFAGELLRMNLETRETELLFAGDGETFLYDYDLGETFGVLMLSRRERMGWNTNPDFFRLDYATKAITPLAEFGEAIGSSVGSDVRHGGGFEHKMHGDTMYFTATLFDACYLMKLENGIVTKLIDKEGSVDGFDVSKDGRILLSALWDMKGVELYDQNGKQLTHFNDAVLRGRYTAVPERCDAVSAGHAVHGFVMKPADFDPEKKYPVILDIHGGPKTVYGAVYFHEMQYWAGQGYFVIFCNPTGSDGRGNEFADIRGKYGTVDYDDIMAFTDAALKAYPAMDAERLYETGGSYGGFMTNWIVGHTERFKACATQRSITNWLSFYGVSDIGIRFAVDQNQADPWGNPEKLWEHSPMKYLDRCKTPTLILHSMEDYRCPVDQGYQMFACLAAHGVDTKLVLFKGENHELSRSGKPKHRVKRLKEITAWFDSHR